MRALIKASAGLFIVVGALVALVATLGATAAFANGAASPYANYVEMMGLIVALGGAVAGASIVLVGGTAYLLSSIDERIEQAIKRIRSAEAAS